MTDQTTETRVAEIDEIMSRIYRRFKDWSQRKFSADDVTWCEVRADILSIIALSTPSPSPSEGLTEEERQLLVGALNSAEQLMLNGDEYSRGRARDLVIGVRRKLDRLVKEGK